ncbi:predicted protein [Thalassiosira pseudonana CCMP1335]|uniref:Uncharacterized protein n=1 Tax=Thalassiosira pseudonana TaxID=35128 RepID=B8CE40_THAPS|nr:predicted protein [Thalassiosira pseudonana CCMP1335]EED88203.1 predicted protein [Thalassiosira pseudonana CCMP1335]
MLLQLAPLRLLLLTWLRQLHPPPHPPVTKHLPNARDQSFEAGGSSCLFSQEVQLCLYASSLPEHHQANLTVTLKGKSSVPSAQSAAHPAGTDPSPPPSSPASQLNEGGSIAQPAFQVHCLLLCSFLSSSSSTTGFRLPKTVCHLLEGSLLDTTSSDITTSTSSLTLLIADSGVTDHMFPDQCAWETIHWLQFLVWVLQSSLSMERDMVQICLHVPALCNPLCILQAHLLQ